MLSFGSSAPLRELVASQKGGRPVGICSVCSAHQFVLEAAMQHASRRGAPLLIEATCNQVNQFGGYTGMVPSTFAAYVAGLAATMEFPLSRVILGGDHLGPNPWKDEPAARAMEKARELVCAYVAAGFAKIHLDASMHCADDDRTAPLPPHIVAERAAVLCQAAEAACTSQDEASRPVYVIGTEVPVPGGAQADDAGLQVTTPDDALATVELFCSAFLARGLDGAWSRVIALVVQPGVEFGDAEIHEYDRTRAAALSSAIESVPGMVYEAHSTDYQQPGALRQLVEDHFAILKVGPGLTFAFREATFALAAMEAAALGGRREVTLSHLPEILEQAMVEDPRDWARYYHGDAVAQAFARRYSLSDRIRYYWPRPAVQAALAQLLHNLTQNPPPLPLLSQYMPLQYREVRAGRLPNTPKALIYAHIDQVLQDYAQACGEDGMRVASPG